MTHRHGHIGELPHGEEYFRIEWDAKAKKFAVKFLPSWALLIRAANANTRRTGGMEAKALPLPEYAATADLPDEDTYHGHLAYDSQVDAPKFSDGTTWLALLAEENNVITNALLRDSSACSVIGRSANSTGDPADIAASTNGHVMQRSSDAVGFALLTSANLDSGFYAEGTFTPTFTFATAGNLSVVYTTQDGRYTRIGNRVTVSVRIAFTPTHTTASGDAQFAGLPFTKLAGSSPELGVVAPSEAVTFPAGRPLVIAHLSASTAYIRVLSFGDGATGSFWSTTQFPTATARTMTFNATYQIA